MNKYFLRNMGYSDINPVDSGFQKCAPSYSFGYFVRDYYLMHYVTAGKGTLYKNGCEYPVHTGQVFLINPGEATKYTADEENPWSYIWIGFTGKISSELDKLAEPVFDMNGAIFEKIKRCTDYINMREAYLASCIYLILCEIFENSSADNISAIKNYIDTNYMNNPKISDIAKNLNLNRKYLARLFKSKTGLTMQDYLTQRKMEAAKSLIKSGYNINETARMTGYSDQSAFSRAFKNHFGYSPSECDR